MHDDSFVTTTTHLRAGVVGYIGKVSLAQGADAGPTAAVLLGSLASGGPYTA